VNKFQSDIPQFKRNIFQSILITKTLENSAAKHGFDKKIYDCIFATVPLLESYHLVIASYSSDPSESPNNPHLAKLLRTSQEFCAKDEL